MFEFLVEKETEARKLSEAEASRVAADVGDLWKDWDEARSKQKAIAEKLRPEIYLDDRPAKERGEGNWKSDVHLNKIYSLSQTQQAFIWDNIYSNNEKLFLRRVLSVYRLENQIPADPPADDFGRSVAAKGAGSAFFRPELRHF